ncbi:chitin synthase chs-1-like [Cottoperca gobio]|uniref:chitin synthase n=1 Tax=Cottoperca gobio TaxID=56716 RepID=A0A6J2QMG2_COTGO|nr:chitin synthase chs-1-like [Cottoperca gobio]
MDRDGDTPKRPWDTCREVPFIEDEQTPWKMIKLLKFISLCVVAVAVFGLALCSKTSFLLLITLSNEGTKTLPDDMKPVALLCIGCTLITSSILLFLKSTWKACYKTSKLPRKSTIALILFFEFLVAVGAAILTIVAMPHLDIVTNVAILNGVAVLSALLQVITQCTAKERNRFLVPSITAFILILLGYVLFLILYIMKDPTDIKMAIWVGLAVGGSFLVSFNWWESYLRLISKNSSSVFFKELCIDMTKCQNLLNIVSSLLRIVVTACVLGAYVPLAQMDWDIVTSIPRRETKIIAIIIGVQLVSSALCHWFSLVACKMHALRRCFILPLYLSSLAVMVLFIVPVIVYYQDYKISLNGTAINFTGYCNEVVDGRNQNLTGSVFPHLVLDVTHTLCFLDMSKITDIGLLTGSAVSWWLGLVLATLHLWYLKVYRIQRTQDLFTRRLYEGAFIEQSLLLNTRFDIQTKNRTKNFRKFDTAMVYLCATMWHETYDEMMNIIISIFRLDRYRPKIEPKYTDFTFDAHIYFDDAFDEVKGSQGRHLNKYAKDLVKILTEVYSIFTNIDQMFFKNNQKITEQKVIMTPYGGRLVITMPQGNLITVHFKDKQLIRHKKRWSQVMYLYYLLGWKLMAKYHKLFKNKNPNVNQNKLCLLLQKEKHNTYILALDGDTDFQPVAVMLLIDRLKMYPRVGAACGRIHPTGSGPAVWFQKFEYAVSHWLQKTAEHVIGCVLCSPGCFSLFRAEALMDDNVMKKYSTKSMEASDYIQYDQGEDRWLCTLLLKQGWRVEYNAASDAYTNAPEDFKELYNQRRRWGPSTLANVIDLLGSTTTISKRNPSISRAFMFYQLFAITSAILAPATICLLIAGSLTFILSMHASGALVLAVIPPVIFLILCFYVKSDTQITIAGVMSIIYAFLMLIVTMSIIGSMVKDKTILTPSSIFIIAMAIIYIITAVMHPQEIQLLFHGFLYIICIPSAYLLLIIYSMVNMNNVSWGTRETKPAGGAATPEPAAKQTKTQKAKSTFQQLFSWCKCCKRSNQTSGGEQLAVSHEVLIIQPGSQPQNTNVEDERTPGEEQRMVDSAFDSPIQCWITQLQSECNDMQLQKESLDKDEEEFWIELQKKYLEPLQDDKERQKKIINDLRELRNKINFAFFTLNALWLVATFTLQIFEASFSIKIPKVNFDLEPTDEDITIDPIGFMFILGFATSVVIQFLTMFYHRIYTLIHYVAFLGTELIKHEPDKPEPPGKKEVSVSESDSTTDNNSDADSEIDDSDDDDMYFRSSHKNVDAPAPCPHLPQHSHPDCPHEQCNPPPPTITEDQSSFLLLITLSNEGTKTIPDEQKPVALLCIGCVLIASSVLLFTKSLWKACYKTSKMPAKKTLALVLFFEFLVAVGAAILTIVAMPHLDIVTNVAILNGVAVLSALLQVITQCTAKERNRFLVPSITAFILILLGYVLLPHLIHHEGSY